MTVEFDTLCGTAQSEDVLRLLIPVRFAQNSGFGPKQTSVHENLNSWIELKKFSGSSGWPTMVLVLPGKTVESLRLKNKIKFRTLKCSPYII